MNPISMRLLGALAAFFLAVPCSAQTQPDAARMGRFSYANDQIGRAAYSTFVIPLDQQKGIQLHPTATTPWVAGQTANYYPWFFKVASYTRYLVNKTGTNTVNYPFAFRNPIASFGSEGGGSPLYIGKSYRFGFYAGGQNANSDLPAEASIQIYSKSSFANQSTGVGQAPVQVDSLDLPHWKDASATGTSAEWKAFGDNGFQKTFTTSIGAVPILETTVQFALADATDESWAVKYKAPLLITHRALAAAKDYYFIVNYTGVTQAGTKVAWMAVNNASSPDTSGTSIPGYAMNFEDFPAWGSTLLKTPNFQGDPAPPSYYGKTAEEIAALSPRFDVALATQLRNSGGAAVTAPAAGTYSALNTTPELQAHSSLDALAKQLGIDPLTIANYVHNEIGLTDALGYNETGDVDEKAVNSAGMNRGALGTYLEGQGSPEEQCALLLYLLRKAGVQAAYVKPPHTAVGGVATSSVAMLDQRLSNLLRMRIKGALTPDGHTPVPQFIGVNYPWVAAYVPSDPSNPTSGKKWIHLFPWLKDTEVIEGQSIEGYLPSGTRSIRQWVRNYVLAGKASPLWTLDAENQNPGNIFTKDLQKNLEDNWRGVSVDDLGVRFRDRKFNRNSWEQFPQPCQVDPVKTYTLSDTLAADDKIYDTMDITISSVQAPAKQITLTGLRTMDFHNRRAVVNFAKASGTNFTLSFTLQPFDLANPASGTNLDFNRAADPNLLKKQRAELTVASTDKDFKFSVTYHRHRAYAGSVGVADQAILGGWASFLGINEFDFGPGGAAAAGTPVDSYFKLGDLDALCVNAGRVTEKMIQIHLEPFWKHEQDRAANPTTVNPDYDLIQETTAYLMGMTYYQRVSRSFDDLKNLFKVHTASMRAHGFAQLGAERNSSGVPVTGSVSLPAGGSTQRIQQPYPVVDMNFFRGAWAAYGDIRADAGGQQTITGLDFMTNLMVVEQSALEDHTIKQYFKEEDADAVSTVDLIHRIQRDTNAGNDVVELTADNYTTFKTKKYSFGGKNLTLQEWAGTNTWAKIEAAFTGWDKDLVRIYITSGPVKGAKDQWQGMGTLIMGKNSGAALIGQVLNGGYGSFSSSMSMGQFSSSTGSFSGAGMSAMSLYNMGGFTSVSSNPLLDIVGSGQSYATFSSASYLNFGSVASSSLNFSLFDPPTSQLTYSFTSSYGVSGGGISPATCSVWGLSPKDPISAAWVVPSVSVTL